MDAQYAAVLKGKLDAENMARLEALADPRLEAFVADAAELCRPDAIRIIADAEADREYIRRRAVENGEEIALATPGHTAHFDGYQDQGRDKEVTRYLVPKDVSLGPNLNAIEHGQGLAEVRGFLAGSMRGRTMYVAFFCLGPTGSPFSLSCVQATDSAYVVHSEHLLYRPGYEQCKRLGGGPFFRFVHSAGKLVGNVSAEPDKKRIYIDIQEDMVYSVNTQYGGNSMGLKKLALRLAIRKADREGWLAEHMFVMGVHGPKKRVTYFTGAFPSACGKTSTAMIPGETIIGDDIAYFRRLGGEARTVNVEAGIFGIIQDAKEKDDPVIWKVLATPGEVIFSNILIKDGRPYWLGMGQEIPKEGINFSGAWHVGKIDKQGVEIPPAHKNARYTIALATLQNLDPRFNDPQGVPVGGIIYGGRDSDTSVPVQQSFDWAHGIITMGATLESETTFATIGAEGVRVFCPMSNLDFLAIPLGRYISNNLKFGEGLKEVPLVFAVNYFLRRKDGSWVTGMRDKAVWMKWMELRVHGEAEAIQGPTGHLPLYADLKKLFKKVLAKAYTEKEYVGQFTIRIPENLAKLDRIEKIYRQDVSDTPPVVLEALAAQHDRLQLLGASKGDYVSPMDL
ncbi:MAG: phosphoenolpyruvate carboxykinase (GTP) [Planctomycetota bacterium]|nr:phosphoenolpyruvate carboxykinase (GTP) [Planctomycetota bacterium]